MKPPARLALVVSVLLLLAATPRLDAQALLFSLFERYLESLRQQAGIPGLSAAIVGERRLVWERYLGYQDLDGAVATSPLTAYPVADLTQVFSATLVLRCVEQGRVALDDPIGRWTSLIREPGATVRHVLAHASNSSAAGGFKYDPDRYAALTPVTEGCAAEPYRKALATEVLERLAMQDSVPGGTLDAALFDDETLDRYASVLARLARPYKVDKRGKATRSEYPLAAINASTGLISTPRDLARYDAALDDFVLLGPESLAAAWTNTTQGGRVLPTGLGWFVQSYNGKRLVWHFGLWPDAYSSLILKVPEQRLTLILLANSDGLSAPFGLDGGDVTSSLFARLFLGLFL